MDNLLIESTKKTPDVAFNVDGRMRISGRSIPEDASKFYDELFDWVYYYCQNPPESTTFDIELEYFNGGSSKALLHPQIAGRNFQERRQADHQLVL
jgi:hypothetical protein